MKKKQFIFFLVICISLPVLSGCWDRLELNDRAIFLGTGWDASGKKGIEISSQFIIPTNTQIGNGGGGGTGKGYTVISATGENVRDAYSNMHNKLSRDVFMAQRRAVLFGEEFAKKGLMDKLDTLVRGPEMSLRTSLFVVKGGTAKTLLNHPYPLEKPSAAAVWKMYSLWRGDQDDTLLNFFIAAKSDGIRPVLPVIEIVNSQEGASRGQGSSERIYQMAGAAIFDKSLKMIGYLNIQESRHLLWIQGLLERFTVSIPINNGNASLRLTKIDSKIVPKIGRNNKIKFNVIIKGEGDVLENNSNLDLMKPKNLEFLQAAFQKQVKKQVEHTITKVQDEYKIDIFGFGEAIHKKYPTKWKTLKKDWDKKFSEVEISLNVDLTVRRVGLSGRSTFFKE